MPTVRRIPTTEPAATHAPLTVLRELAGEAVYARGVSYARGGHVVGLARTAAGEYIGWVDGSERYATRVSLRADQVAAACTCPYDGICKHVVALALVAAQQPAATLPAADDDDPRLRLLDPAAALVADTVAISVQQAFLQTLSHANLLALVHELVQRFPDVRAAIMTRQLADADIGALEARIRRRLRGTGRHAIWSNGWERAPGHDSQQALFDELQELLVRGHADALVRLGTDILASGIEQIESTEDDGDTALAVATAMTLVFTALPRSTLTPHAQLLWAIDADLADKYDICHAAETVYAQPYPPAAWSLVADTLQLRSATSPPPIASMHPIRRYDREPLINMTLMALERAGRADECIALLTREATEYGSYWQLVERLEADGQLAAAEHWARVGVIATNPAIPGLRSQLRAAVIRLRTAASDWPAVAALRAEEFFFAPTSAGWHALLAAAEQAQVAPAVRAAARQYLETGALPHGAARTVGTIQIPAWPLPESGFVREPPPYQLGFPQIGVLIAIAIETGQTDDLLHWYDTRDAYPFVPLDHDRVANALAERYPDRAAAIWHDVIAARIAQTNTPSYQEAVRLLRKLRAVRVQQHNLAGWQRYVQELRDEHRRKRRLAELLNSLLREQLS